MHFSSQPTDKTDVDNDDKESGSDDEYEYEYEYEYEDDNEFEDDQTTAAHDDDTTVAAADDVGDTTSTSTPAPGVTSHTPSLTPAAADPESENTDESESEDDDEESDEDGVQQQQFVYGEDSDDEFTETLASDVRDDPWFNEMNPVRQQVYLFRQRHQNPDAWHNQHIPHAVQTSGFDYRTIKSVKRFPGLGKYAQSYSGGADGNKTWKWDIANVKLNHVDQFERGVDYKQPTHTQLMPMIHNKEVAKWKSSDIDYRVRSGDVIELVMFTNLQKKKTQKIRAMVLMVRKKWEITGSIMIRNVESDGLTITRQYPLHSPWIKSLAIVKRYKVKRKRLYYMYNAPANVTDPGLYGDQIGVRSRSEHFRWMRETEEGMKYARDYKLKRKMYFQGMRTRQGWARKVADLYKATAITKNMKGPYKNALREMKYRLKDKPHKIA